MIPVRGQLSSIVNPFRRKSLSSATEEESFLRAGLGTLVSAAYLLSIAAQAAPSRTEVRSVETDAARPIKLSDGLRWLLAAYSLARRVVGPMGSDLEVHAELMNSSPHN